MFDRKALLSGVNAALYTNPDECTKVDIVKNFIFAVKQAFETDAVAIRLFEGGDFPYYTTLGFSDSFVEAEKHLCPHSSQNSSPHNGDKNACLECICGSIASGTVIDGMGNTTINGSFWTSGASSEILVGVVDRKIRIRGTCLADGYESICVIQIKWQGDIVGILQINDRRKDIFNNNNVICLEGLCACLGDVLGPLITSSMAEAEKEKIFLDNMMAIAKSLKERIESL